ncbi:MAG: tRNA epoxyqueuosine(34) reductase QueG [Firmicutes bacterium]|uniref:Epoxyqueuosine reductase n=1 Tax=Melghirimyces thermohalophilus TaxID=1236220 RepID=A0A1G6RCI9_9BACL|nr:tRNA epoxyqueuosine(34) reductase QueG [Melghirimyces thermohalophilus]MDA8351683.1 tRNA epoxyqueuosine(34) reductase QueG [Bacillota bacterium]SDD01626.1 epoxyqueuosine reductase [Melghirimyces thermohalophilus]
MKPADIKAALQEAAKELNIDKIGFAAADPFDELKERLRKHRKAGYESGFEEPDLEKRTDPQKSLPGARSIIAIALAYPTKMDNAPVSKPGAYRGVFCRASWGEDYHHVLKRKLEALRRKLVEWVPDAKAEIMVDTGALSDRAVAERAGIGWSGKNTSIITPEFGSRVYLGEMLTDVYLPPDQPIENACGECTACLDACPTGALVGPGQLNSQACLAYLTQTKGFLAEEYRDKLGNFLYGFETCQAVCPYNRGKNFTHHPEFQPEAENVKPLLKPLLHMSNRQFRQRFGSMAGSWRGKKPIQRNAIIALGRYRDRTAVPDLVRLLEEDPRPVIRGTAAWALGRIGGGEAAEALNRAQEVEPDEQVAVEIEHAIEMCRMRETADHRTYREA